MNLINIVSAHSLDEHGNLVHHPVREHLVHIVLLGGALLAIIYLIIAEKVKERRANKHIDPSKTNE